MDDTNTQSTAFNALFGGVTTQDNADSVDSAGGVIDNEVDNLAIEDAALAEALGEVPASIAASKRKAAAKLLSPGALVVYLLKGYIDRDNDKFVYESLLRQEIEVSEFCRKLFLRLIIDHEAGYAYVRSLAEEDLPSDASLRPPQLLSRRPLSFYASFMLILLRQRLLDFDMSGQFGRLVLERSDIISLVKAFLHNVNNERLLEDKLNKAIDDLCSLGLLAKSKYEGDNTKIERIEVKRIISVLVTPEILKQADEYLNSYVRHLSEGTRKRLTTNNENLA